MGDQVSGHIVLSYKVAQNSCDQIKLHNYYWSVAKACVETAGHLSSGLMVVSHKEQAVQMVWGFSSVALSK